jgi:rhodanese-related sulfurtransferase
MLRKAGRYRDDGYESDGYRPETPLLPLESRAACQGHPRIADPRGITRMEWVHYAFDAWMGWNFPAVRFERYVDDAVVHCADLQQATMLRDAIGRRMAEVGLQLHPDKTRIVYCKDSNSSTFAVLRLAVRE